MKNNTSGWCSNFVAAEYRELENSLSWGFQGTHKGFQGTHKPETTRLEHHPHRMRNAHAWSETRPCPSGVVLLNYLGLKAWSLRLAVRNGEVETLPSASPVEKSQGGIFL
ncbi:hypothetical protein [Candidatus Thiosymbion oneisti]|uniref:hypothetical protein n=1 Tax=Candidatus Thiosymbion oneisti TaxID=589554 RepID=UPI00106117A7|nr:hypothetical protein [Candidatus Thiosymbion oneisti]